MSYFHRVLNKQMNDTCTIICQRIRFTSNMTLESIKKNKALKIERIGLKDKTEIWIDNKDNGAQKMRKNKNEEGL